MMRARWTAVGLFGLVFACQGPEKPRPPGLLDQAGNPVASPTASVAEPQAITLAAPVFDDLSASTPSQVAKPAAAPSPEPEARPVRDLASELLDLFPPPTTCLDLGLAAKSPGPLVVSAEAMVMPSGRISRVNVQAPGQGAQNLRCIEGYIGQRSLARDVPDAPISVRASLPLEVVAEEK